MNIIDWKLLTDVTFKTQCYRKNFDLTIRNDSFITECDGKISQIRLSENKSPIIIGEYGFSIWNVGMGNAFDVNIKELLERYQDDNIYLELLNVVNNKLFDIYMYDKLILIHSLVLCADYRKRGITEEFIEFLYRDFYDKKNAIIVLVKPFQNNSMDYDHYLEDETIHRGTNKNIVSHETSSIPAVDYYSLNELLKKTDTELNEYKLFAVATKCGLNRIGESHLFMFSPEKTIKRIKEKQKNIEHLEII